MRALVSCDHMRKKTYIGSENKNMITMNYQKKKGEKKMSVNLMIRERSIILTGPKSTIHYEYYIMSPI